MGGSSATRSHSCSDSFSRFNFEARRARTSSRSGWSFVDSSAPRQSARNSLSGPSFQTHPILRIGVRVCHCNSSGRRSQFLCRKLLDPLDNLSSESISVHPFHERCEIGRILCGKRLYSFQQQMEFFLIELPIKIQAEKIIAEGDLLRHLELLREVIPRSQLIARPSI